jgi:transcriptional regulator with XRE-family HTH domain
MSGLRDPESPASVLAFFGTELRRLRTDAKLSQEELGQRVSYSGSLVGMIETARRAPARDFAERCDEALATGGVLARLWPLVSQEVLPRWFQQFDEVERVATSIRSWEPLVIPGLLQTEDYARALIAAWLPDDGRDLVEQQVAARMERQKLLDREDPPLMWMIIGEAALRAPVGGSKVLSEQLRRLLDIEAEHPKVIVQVVPLAAEAHPGSGGPLLLLSRGGELDVAYLEIHDRGHLYYRPDDVARYALFYDLMRAVALPPDTSRRMIADLAEEILT